MIYGILALFGFNFNTKFIQEAEIKHGRTAMLAVPTLVGLDIVNPDMLSINELSSTPIENQLLLLGMFGISEFAQIFEAYKFPYSIEDWFQFKNDHVPGNYSFDPLSLNIPSDIEISTGRVAMLAAGAIMSKELLTNSVF